MLVRLEINYLKARPYIDIYVYKCYSSKPRLRIYKHYQGYANMATTTNTLPGNAIRSVCKLRVPELLKLCKEYGITVPKRSRKVDLVKLIQDFNSEGETSADSIPISSSALNDSDCSKCLPSFDDKTLVWHRHINEVSV